MVRMHSSVIDEWQKKEKKGKTWLLEWGDQAVLMTSLIKSPSTEHFFFFHLCI